jgi:sugar O-acyltransferase (sialic acid O-acetyltransferase NeuD family)
MKTSVLILGSSGHAKVLIDCLHADSKVDIVGILDINSERHGQTLLGEQILGSDDLLSQYSSEKVTLVNGIGSVSNNAYRAEIFCKFKGLGYNFLSVIHPKASISSDVILDEGVQLMAGCIIQPGCRIGNNVIVNTHASIDHDCRIKDHVHLAPGAVCSGGVTIERGVHVGTGAVVIQNIVIGKESLIAAGAVVVNNIAPNTKVFGMPAK